MKYPPNLRAPAFLDGRQACEGADVNLFFPRPGASAAKAIARAKDICSSCELLHPCLEYAIDAQGTPGVYVDGVWGHTTKGERTAIRQRRLSSDFFQVAS